MTRKKKRLFLLSTITSLSVLFTLGAFKTVTDDLITRIIAQANFFSKNYPQEKIYLHFDKPYYATGEDMWYKAYLVNAAFLTPDSATRNAYVELISPTGKVIQRNILQVRGGMASGDFALADSLEAGTYRVRAYTNWMRNFSDGFFFKQDFRIWKNSAGAPPQAEEAYSSGYSDSVKDRNSPNLDVQFFPESGNLIDGIESRVAFKAIDAAGRGTPIAGSLLNEKGEEVAVFRSTHLGMGSFVFTPGYGTTYTARVKAGESGQPTNFPFPEVQERGVRMQVNNFLEDKLYVQVAQKVAGKPGGREVVLIGQSRGVVRYASKAKFTDSSFIVEVPKENFPAGVTQLTLFDAATGEPLSERLVFIRKRQNNLTLSIKSSKPSYGPRELVQLEITATDANGGPVAANLSLAATDAALSHRPYARNIHTYLLLSSDLQGAIEQPAYYFKDQLPATKQALDNLMLTQGWSRFVWKDILAAKFPAVNYPIKRGLTVSGQVKHLNGGEPWPNSRVQLYLPADEPLWAQATTDAAGNFQIDGLDFYGNAALFLQAENENGRKDVSIVLDSRTFPSLHMSPAPLPEARPPYIEAYLKRAEEKEKADEAYAIANGEHLLQEVVIEGKQQAEQGFRKMYSRPDNVVQMGDLVSAASYRNVLEAIQGRVPGVAVRGDWPNTIVSIRGRGEPLFLLDGTPTDISMITSIDPALVETIDILKNASTIFGSRGYNGVIAVYTKRAAGTYANVDAPGVLSTSLAGYYKAREFYAPKYNAQKPEHELPDMRATLLWAPHVVTDTHGKATVSFYNADNVEAIHVVAEGITPDGLIGSQTAVLGTAPTTAPK
ncbi:TonB-dependent receptor plug domain-containing protein [Pontibacter russatus]|uniref:TonB-dependent receptor plug domain-containing protein n=1 Tax=Pontibacter russatus TaxID=2694929 RepID=UPI0013799937|nr:TonB-dependent receptor plug domain-containing protein [Pontibacter russatus]